VHHGRNLGTGGDFGGPSIAAAMRRRSLPQLVIPVPCSVDWNTMTRIDSDGVARFCDRCEHRARRFRWLTVALAAVAFWTLAVSLRPLAKQVWCEWLDQAFGIVSNGKVIEVAIEDELAFVIVEHLGRVMDPDRLDPLPPSPARPHAIPGPDWRPPLPAVDRAEALHKVEADEGILNPPKRRPRYLWPEMEQR
jgi:hypothetical protein